MVKVTILIGVAASRRKFVTGQMSEFCLYLRVNGQEVGEVIFFMPHQKITSFAMNNRYDYAHSVHKSVAYVCGFSPFECELAILNGWCNNFQTGECVRCQPLPIEFVDAFRDALICHGFNTEKK